MEVKEPLKENYSLKQLVEIFPEARPYLKNRLKVLEELKTDLKIQTIGLYQMIIEKAEKKENQWFWDEYVNVFYEERYKRMVKEIMKISWTLNPPGEGWGTITPEMIERAKQVPFNELIEFNKAGKVKCLWHQESHASLSWNKKTNLIKCFGCGKSLDTIQFIIEMKGMKFPGAVRYLMG